MMISAPVVQAAIDPEISKALVNAVLVIIPAIATLIGALVAWAVAKLKQNGKDNDMLHEAKRAVEQELGVKTTWNPQTRRFDVSRSPTAASSVDPEPFSPKGD